MRECGPQLAIRSNHSTAHNNTTSSLTQGLRVGKREAKLKAKHTILAQVTVGDGIGCGSRGKGSQGAVRLAINILHQAEAG
jgi:hypothetical protein